MNNNQNMHRNNKKKISRGKKVTIWITSIIVLILLIIGGISVYAYHNIHEAYDKTYKKASGTTKQKGNHYHMVVKVKGTKKDGSADKLLYVTGTKGKKDMQVKKLQDGTYTENKDGKVTDNKSGQVLGNTKDSNNSSINSNDSNNDDTSKNDIANAKKQTGGQVNYYTSVNMGAAASAVDALGGLDVDGQHMNGSQAVKYYESGHAGAIMAAAMNRKEDIKALFNKKFLNKAADSTHTNMTWDQAKSLVK